MKDRLQKLLVIEKISPSKFAEIIGVQRSSISHILSGRNKPSYDVITNIITRFPKINPDWLITGNGEMYRKPVQTNLFDQIEANKRNSETKKNTEQQVVIKTSEGEVKTSNSKDYELASENRKFAKEVERIIVFYIDKTFSEYKPE